jgi:phosphatidate phosphatase PAH1
VSLWVQNASGTWEQSGPSVATDATGSYSFKVPAAQQAKGVGGHAYVLLEGDGSCSEHGVYAWPSGTKIVITDIDGTLTRSNAEFQTQVTQPSYVPLEHPSASDVMKKWASKGYRVVFLSARPDNFRDASRVWLRDKGINFGPIVTAKSFVTGPAAVSYKTAALQKMVNDYGWQIVAAYGNEPSDVQAYANVNVPKAQTFTVENANGIEGTVGIPGDDYAPHIANYVEKQADAQQP